MSPKVLLIGATGHIGGTVLHTIHTHHNVDISVLVRNQSDAELLQHEYSVIPIIGTLEDVGEVADHIRSSDIIISLSLRVPYHDK
jgi:uncharacterized protein YbjT (DUF2867 family)